MHIYEDEPPEESLALEVHRFDLQVLGQHQAFAVTVLRSMAASNEEREPLAVRMGARDGSAKGPLPSA